LGPGKLALASAVAVVLAAAAPAARAQEFLDRGTFVVERNGVEIAREDFAIRRAGGGGVLAVASIHYRDRDLRPALDLSADLQPLSYQLDVSVAGRVTERVSAQFGRGRVAARVATQQREVLREFPAASGVAVLDQDAFHQFYFIPRGAAGASRRLQLFLPRVPAIVGADVRRLGPDTVRVAERPVPADRFVLRLDDGEAREFWFTPSGDLVRVAVPSSGIVATRTALPPR
jgi:hypothetical protein